MMSNAWAEGLERVKSTVVFLGTLKDGGEPNISATGSILPASTAAGDSPGSSGASCRDGIALVKRIAPTAQIQVKVAR
jgi:hypothetical protein